MTHPNKTLREQIEQILLKYGLYHDIMHDDLEALIKDSNNKLLDRVEKEAIGEDEFVDPADFYLSLVNARNELRAAQRQALNSLREEKNEQ